MFSSYSLCNNKDAMLRWISENVFKFFFMQWQGCNVKINKVWMFSSSSLCNDKDTMLRWISENVFKFFLMQWQGCDVKINKWGCFLFLLYAMTRMQC